jgi:hypothetical protein
MSGVQLSKESTPQERLEKYKKDLAKLAEEENTSISKGARTEKVKKTTPALAKPAKPKEAVVAPGPPRQLISPSKLELREAITISGKTKRPLPRRRDKSKGQKELVRLRVRAKSFESMWKNVRNKRDRLEKKYERGFVGEKEYKKQLTNLVNEGHELHRKKAKIDREIQALESR